MVKLKDKADGIELTCKRCGHTWLYRGYAKYVTCCGVCKGHVNVRKRRLELGLGVE
jgi:uncharacterized protein (DUF983 family)